MTGAHEGDWSEAGHYAAGQCGQSCPCCRYEEARGRDKASWFGVCTVCAESRGKKRKRTPAGDKPRTRRRL